MERAREARGRRGKRSTTDGHELLRGRGKTEAADHATRRAGALPRLGATEVQRDRSTGKIAVESEGDEMIAKKLSIVGLWCVQWYPVDRPSISGVVQMLEGETENLTIPPNPFASTTTPEKNTRNIQERPRDHHALSIISEHDELE
ncbi:hypothetical protein Syun_013367 [Stephania yunnanensis]|uniref:Uncharacterized protein n=1 Tax=Stephania yunnanensis TaxID=152371 RepID=A0AAP0K174_9MAGN